MVFDIFEQTLRDRLIARKCYGFTITSGQRFDWPSDADCWYIAALAGRRRVQLMIDGVNVHVTYATYSETLDLHTFDPEAVIDQMAESLATAVPSKWDGYY